MRNIYSNTYINNYTYKPTLTSNIFLNHFYLLTKTQKYLTKIISIKFKTHKSLNQSNHFT